MNAIVCGRCGSSSRIARGLCLNCLLQNGIEAKNCDNEQTLDQLLDKIDIRDADWRLGNYQILEEIGRGGMGVIYRARQRHSRRIVALKRVLSYHADSKETLARFRREAEAAASLDHPNILPIYEVGQGEDGLPFFSMKFAGGGSLLEARHDLKRNPREIVRLIAKVTRAVQYAHSQGILHRDLKPGNVLLDGRGEPMVSDFGLAKWLDASSDLTRTLTIFGTPGYIAPEQANGPAANLRPTADVYSIGAVLFDMLTGRPPFLGEHALAVIKQAEEKPAPKLRSLVPTIDRDLETICARCLEREASARYVSAHSLATDFQCWLEGRPILARPVSSPVRIWRWSNRNRRFAVSLALCIFATATAAIWQIQSRHLAATVRENQLVTNSVAVIPFLDLDEVQPDETTAKTVAVCLKGGLVRLGSVRIEALTGGVAAWAGTGSVDDISAANGRSKARLILTGTRRLIGSRSRFSVRLMNAANGDVLMTRSFDTLPKSISADTVEKELAPLVRSMLSTRDWSIAAPAARDPGLRDAASRNFIVSGRGLMFRSTILDYDRSIRCLKRAIELEPQSAIAHAYLSATQIARFHFSPDPDMLVQGENEAKEALRIEPDLPEGHRALAAAYFHRNLYLEALEEELRSIEMGGPEERSASFLGEALIAMGQPARALGWLDLAKHSTASPGSWDAMIGDCWSLLEEDERAELAYKQAIDLRPESPDGWVGLCHLRLLKGDAKSARSTYEENWRHLIRYEEVNDNAPKDILAQIEFFARDYRIAEQLYSELASSHSSGGRAAYSGLSYTSALGRIRQALGDRSHGDALLITCLAEEKRGSNYATDPNSLYRIAAIESSLGNGAIALEYLRAAIAAGWIDHRSLQLDPRFDGISASPVFRQIIFAVKSQVDQQRRQQASRTMAK